jgi:ABC-type multidrug transport system fused ATPase/permease subunit
LEGIDMEIPKGKMIAIVGESGAGKSTLIDMIMGFNQPTKGCVSFDGVVLQEFDIDSYRKRIGYVPQECILFNASIRDNLLWAKEGATDEEIKYACQQANADEFIEKLPQCYDTLVGDRGICLSGGQRQRVALARAMLRKPELLFLDEATSSLDTHSERLIQQAIENIAKQTTIIVIAHRLSTIVNADYVYVLKQGSLVEQGTHLELIQMNGHFNRMVKLQMLESAT